MRSLSVTAIFCACFIFASASEGTPLLSADVAWSDTNNAIDLPLNNPQLPAWNQAFDDSDLAWGAALGWQINDHISVHFGYSDLGEFSSSSRSLNAPRVGLDVNEYSLNAKLRFPLSGQLDATWWLGMSSADFDADGTLQIPTLVARPLPSDPPPGAYWNPFASTDPLAGSTRVSNPFIDPDVVFPSVTDYEFADPDDEVGFLWGFGIDWHLNENFSITGKYLRHNLRLLEIDTFNLGVMYSL